MKNILIGFAIGLVVALGVLIWQVAKRKNTVKDFKKEIDKLKSLLSDRMDIESEGISKLKKDLEEFKKQNENLRVTNSALMQKTDKAEVQRLHIYQKAVDRLVINSPGFGAAWQSALKDSEEEFAKIYSGTEAFMKKITPSATNAKLIDEKDD